MQTDQGVSISNVNMSYMTFVQFASSFKVVLPFGKISKFSILTAVTTNVVFSEVSDDQFLNINLTWAVRCVMKKKKHF